MNKYRFILIAVFTLFSILNGYSQSVTGRVVDQAGEPIVGVVVIVENSTSGIGTHATVTDALGHFEFKIAAHPYKLTFQHLSYQERVMSGSDDDLGVVVLEEATLAISDVVVKGSRPIVQVEQGKLVYDVARLSEGKVVNNAYEAVAQLPAIFDNNGSLFIQGASTGTTVILNGKKSMLSAEQLAELLKSTPVERLEKVETSYNAPPQWHTTGAAINIVLKRDQGQLNGQLQAGYSYNHRASNYESTGNFYVSGKKFSADVMASYRRLGGLDKSVEHNEHYVKGVLYDVNQLTEEDGRIDKVTLYTSLGYKPKENQIWTLSYYGDMQPNNWTKSRTHNNYFGDSHTEGHSDNGSFHGTTLSYEAKGISTGVSYTYLNNDGTQRLFGEESMIDSRSLSTIQRLNAYADVTHSFPKKWNFGYGGMFTFLNNKLNQATQFSGQEQDAPQILKESLDEYTASAYVSLGHELKKGIGLYLTFTGEYYCIEDYRKFNLLPSLSFSCPITEQHALQFSLVTIKNNPSYGMQQEHTNFLSAYNIEMGNSTIRPETYYALNTSYILKNKYIFRVAYSYVDHNIQNQEFLSPDKLQAITQPVNISFASIYSLSASIPFSVGKWWDGRIDVVGSRYRSKADDWHGIAYDTSLFSAQAALNNTFKISNRPQIALSLSAYVATPMLYGISKTSTVWYVNAGAQYTFAKKRAVLSLTCNDIFQSGQRKTRTILSGQSMYFKNNFYSRFFNATFTYKFGGYSGTRYHNENMGVDRNDL